MSTWKGISHGDYVVRKGVGSCLEVSFHILHKNGKFSFVHIKNWRGWWWIETKKENTRILAPPQIHHTIDSAFPHGVPLLELNTLSDNLNIGAILSQSTKTSVEDQRGQWSESLGLVFSSFKIIVLTQTKVPPSSALSRLLSTCVIKNLFTRPIHPLCS